MKTIRLRLEPQFAAAGFNFEARSRAGVSPGEPRWIDFRNASTLLSIRYIPREAALVAEQLDEVSGTCREAATTLNSPRSLEELMSRVDVFVEEVERLLISG
ncbi:hypothetical protein [Lacipirellula sp.]|uniref:hypothetical protein n=1 Tax=Lacipirellula sp. TaxID=2691419 RepID=UPI003D104023